MILHGDVRAVLPTLPEESVHCVVTSPPYWGLRDYGVAGQLGLEATPYEYIDKMVAVFREVRRVLRSDGTLWLNMGDSYSNDTKWGGQSGGKNYTSAAGGYQGQRVRRGKDCDPKRGAAAYGQPMQNNFSGLKPKDLVGMPWRLALALQADGWYLRSDIIWSKPNPMPESVTDRPTKSHEYIFLMSKSERYYYDAEAIREEASGGPADAPRNQWDTKDYAVPGQKPQKRLSRHLPGNRTHRGATAYANGAVEHRTKVGLVTYSAKMREIGVPPEKRNKRSVWTVATQPFSEAHFATFPEELIRPCILAGCPPGGTVLDPFFGSGTTGLVARSQGCKYIGIELNAEYIRIAAKRLSQEVLDFAPDSPEPTEPLGSGPIPSGLSSESESGDRKY